jgi:isoquinoline 1-oxidoreductase beta subunit
VFGAGVKGFDDNGARRISGVHDVFEIPLIRGSGVAVVADRFWTAKQARDRLAIDWDLATVERADTSRLLTKYRDLARMPGKVAATRGDEKKIDSFPASDRIVAEYDFPYLAHTPMEPLNTTVRFDGDRAEAWAGSQFQTTDQAAIAEVLGLKPEQVTFHTMMAGGGFGRRATLDSHVAREAATIAKRFRGTPVKLVWSREDDVQGGYYRPMHVHRVEIGVGPDGMPLAWRHVIVGQSITAGTAFESLEVKDGVDSTAVEGTIDTRYDIPNFHVSAHHPTVNVPVLWWRSSTSWRHEPRPTRSPTAASSSRRMPSGCVRRWISWTKRARRGAPRCLPGTPPALHATRASAPRSPARWMFPSRAGGPASTG